MVTTQKTVFSDLDTSASSSASDEIAASASGVSTQDTNLLLLQEMQSLN